MTYSTKVVHGIKIKTQYSIGLQSKDPARGTVSQNNLCCHVKLPAFGLSLSKLEDIFYPCLSRQPHRGRILSIGAWEIIKIVVKII